MNCDGGYKPHGFLYSGGTFTEIVAPDSYITRAYGINAAGQIVGLYQEGGNEHGFLATLTSIPGDFAPADCDVDGSDLAKLIANPGRLDITTFAENFGENVCP